jgi:hypothetical protein
MDAAAGAGAWENPGRNATAVPENIIHFLRSMGDDDSKRFDHTQALRAGHSLSRRIGNWRKAP